MSNLFHWWEGNFFSYFFFLIINWWIGRDYNWHAGVIFLFYFKQVVATYHRFTLFIWFSQKSSLFIFLNHYITKGIWNITILCWVHDLIFFLWSTGSPFHSCSGESEETGRGFLHPPSPRNQYGDRGRCHCVQRKK